MQNKNAKRLISILICLAMVLAVLPMAVFAEGTTTLYCQAPDTWTTCYIYWWGSSSSNPGWPGYAMTKGEDGIWYYEVPSDASNVIFTKTSSGPQTSDLDMPTNDKCPDCGGMLYHKKGKNLLIRKNESCGYKVEIKETEAPETPMDEE